MRAYLVIRDGQVKLRLPAHIMTVESDGKLKGSNGERVIDGKLAEIDGCLAKVQRLAKARKWDQIDSRYWLGLGESQSGAVVMTDTKWTQQQVAAMTPGQRAWREVVSPAIEAAERAESADYYDPAAICQTRIVANTAIKSWRETYPDDARLQEADRLDADAAHEDHLAMGALTYDADGWLDSTERQRRHDEHKAKADGLRARAAALRGGQRVD